MTDQFVLKDHVKVYKGGLPGTGTPWTLLDNFNLVSIDIDRWVQNEGGFNFVNQPGSARIVMRSNIAGGGNIDQPYHTAYSVLGNYTAIKVVATIYPDTAPEDVTIFWGLVESSSTTYSTHDRDLTDEHDYQLVLNCVDMLAWLNKSPLIAGPSFAAGYPEDRFVDIISGIYPALPYNVAYSGMTNIPAETINPYTTAIGELLQELQTSDLAYVATDYVNERFVFYGRYFLPDLTADLDTWEASADWVGFSDTHVDTDDHYCCRDVTLAFNTAATPNYYNLVKKSDPTVYYRGGTSYPGGLSEGWSATINCSTLTDLTHIGDTISLADPMQLENVTASAIRHQDGRLRVALIGLQPVLDFARIVLHRDGQTINKAFVITRMHHRIDADGWNIDVAGVRLAVTTLPGGVA